jgi:TolA-binding protein
MKIQPEKISRDLFDESFSKIDDPVLTVEINDYMRTQFDLDEIMNDPALEEIRSETSNIINSRKSGVININEAKNRNFISDALLNAPGRKIYDDIQDIRLDLSKTNIEDISAEWVNDWHRKKQMQGGVSKERTDFISAALESDGTTEQLNTVNLNESTVSIPSTGEKTGRTRMLRFVSLSAAAVLGAVLIIKSLQPTDPQKLFSSYYEPFSAVSPVVRGTNSNELYISAMDSYKAGDYQNAEQAFKQSANMNPSFGSPVFYLGLTALETGEYNAAITNLDSVIKGSGAYSKEAKWYLGLAYLRTDNKEKARKCFEELAASSGYYKERSEKILRRLK